MKHLILIIALGLVLLTTSQAQYPNWEPIVANLPSSVAGATSAASDGYGVHLVGVYSGVVKHFYLSNDNTIIFNNLSVTGGQYPNVTFFDGKVRVIMKEVIAGQEKIRVYQSTNGGSSWPVYFEYSELTVPVFNINAYSDGYGTHIVWDNVESNSTYDKEIYYIRYSDISPGFVDYKNVTDLASPSQGARAKITTTSNKAHITFVGNEGQRLTSRDINLQTGNWDDYYVKLSESASPVPYRSVNTVSIGDFIYSISPSDIITGYPCSQELFFSYRHKDAVNWQDHESVGPTGLGTSYLSNNILVVGDKIHMVNGYNTLVGEVLLYLGIRYRTYSQSSGWSNEEVIATGTQGQAFNSIIVTGGRYGIYALWNDTYPSFSQRMRRNPFVPTVNLTSPVLNGWNMGSVPVAVSNFTKTVVWPTAISDASEYINGGYVPVSYLSNEKGDWIKYGVNQNISYTGARIDMKAFKVKAGWNIIGSISHNVHISQITSIPSGIIASKFYKYENAYSFADYITPGNGYWVKVHQDGEIILTPEIIYQITDDEIRGYDKFIIADAAGNEQVLYVRNGAKYSTLADVDFEMPPPLLVADFDVRFESDKIVETVYPNNGVNSLPISISAIEYPITIRWELNPENEIDYSFLQNSSGFDKIVSKKIINNYGNLILNNDGTGKVRLEGKVGKKSEFILIPKTYNLEQNYPNPFNPVTIVNYQLPIGNYVTLKIYDVLGREVATLVDEFKEAGYYEVAWDATNVPSGVYFYRLQSGNFNSVKKMLLLR